MIIFVRSITATSATDPVGNASIPAYHSDQRIAEKGKYGVACAYATILIAIVYASIVVMNFVIAHF